MQHNLLLDAFQQHLLRFLHWFLHTERCADSSSPLPVLDFFTSWCSPWCLVKMHWFFDASYSVDSYWLAESRGIFTFIITVGCKMFLQEFVCKDAGLMETPDGFAYFKVNVSSHHFIEEVVVGDDPRGKEAEWHFHVFVSVEGCCEVEISDVKAHIPCIWGAKDAITMNFCCCHVGSVRS
jgi:hypothetical protein